MSSVWHIEILEGGTSVIEHWASPRFRALWSTGLEDLAGFSGPCWTDEGHGEDDALTLHAFRWHDPVPDQGEFEILMREALVEIDNWIAAWS